MNIRSLRRAVVRRQVNRDHAALNNWQRQRSFRQAWDRLQRHIRSTNAR